MSSIQKNIGNKGEDIAADFLVKNGYKILDRNYQAREGEIDIIGLKDETYHFIEVKTLSRSKADFERSPEQAVDEYKIKKLIKTANHFFLHSDMFPEEKKWCIDVIAIFMNWDRMTADLRFISNIVRD